MWSWKPYNQENTPNSQKNTYLDNFFKNNPNSLDKPSFYNNINVKKEYNIIKENHPYYKTIHEPHQKVIKMTYLDQLRSRQDPPLQFVNNYIEVKELI